ncbi:MAG TPA: betaine-aldehyde dehydrogenase [Gammaproteobacteria bacterium]|nr:betaine-aldehyde dehydrogenase [Gammaproteobacteria bacterium]|tara:strand:- start:540 stop:2003 length:1464 start_codon:yes stop_codon:yes gene_type:complete
MTSTSANYQLLINGELRDAERGAIFVVDDPATESVVAEVACASVSDLEAAVSAARVAFDQGPWPRLAPFARGRVLQAIADGIRTRFDELAQLETRCGGKTLANSRNEVDASARVFEYYAGSADKFFGDTIPMGADVLDFTLREPIGVVAQITPWNFPLLAASWKTAPALACGCAIILKPASYTPITSLILGQIALAAGIPPGVFNVLPGPGGELGNKIARHPMINKIAFTGETRTGAELLKQSADDIKRVSLELGGKSPNIVFADADLDKAASAAVSGAFGNAGQSCSARTRLFVERGILETFTKRLINSTAQFRVGDPMAHDTSMGPLISSSSWHTVNDYVEGAVAEGADLLCGGGRPAGLSEGHYFSPTVLANANNDMRAAREEIFGPVVVMIPFDDETDAIAMANDNEYGLNASVWSRDVGKAVRVARALQCGMVSVNSNGSASRYGLFAPFGGHKKSGLGRELSMRALELYTEEKNIFIDHSG